MTELGGLLRTNPTSLKELTVTPPIATARVKVVLDFTDALAALQAAVNATPAEIESLQAAAEELAPPAPKVGDRVRITRVNGGDNTFVGTVGVIDSELPDYEPDGHVYVIKTGDSLVEGFGRTIYASGVEVLSPSEPEPVKGVHPIDAARQATAEPFTAFDGDTLTVCRDRSNYYVASVRTEDGSEVWIDEHAAHDLIEFLQNCITAKGLS